MTRSRAVPVALLLGLALLLAVRDGARWARSDARFDGPASQRVFDPTRNAAADLKAAEAQARAQGKPILMDVGGNWCPWCLLLDYTLQHDAALRSLQAENFVVLHVNWSSGNRNEAVLSQFPQPTGFPQWYLLTADGHLLEQKSPTDFQNPEDASGAYNRTALADYLRSHGGRR